LPRFGRVTRVKPRALEAIAIENAIEGCVRETFGALVAAWQAREARDPVVRAVMKRIARDETNHASLGWAIDTWARTRLDRAARRRVDAARAVAVRAFSLMPEEPLNARDVVAAGLPNREVQRALFAGLAPLYEASNEHRRVARFDAE
jgi:hypothetical protein